MTILIVTRAKIFRGPALSGETSHLMTELKRIHSGNPLSYTFLGPSGLFVMEFANWFSRSINSSIPRSNFLVMEQLAFDLYDFRIKLVVTIGHNDAL